MKPVTDPELLRILEGGQPVQAAPGGPGKPVTDPALLEQLNAPTPPQAPGNPVVQAADWVGQKAGEAWRGVKSAVTGEGRSEGYPELPSEFLGQVVPGKGSPGAQMGFAASDKGKLGIIAQYDPEMAKTAEFDPHGNMFVTYKGKPHYLNAPGLSSMDAEEMGAAVGIGAPFMGAAGAVTGGMGLLGRAVGTGVATGGASVAQDFAARGFGSQEPVDWERAGIAAATGGAFEMAAPAFGRLWRSFFRQKNLFDPQTGQATAAGLKAMERAGIPKEAATPQFLAEFKRMVDEGFDPAAAARAAEGQSLPVKVPLSKGQQSGLAGDQILESAAYKGALGEPAERIARDFGQQQQEALRANIPAIQGRLSGSQAQVSNIGDAGQMVQQRLQRDAGVLKGKVDDAYNLARGAQATVPGVQVARIGQEMAERAGDFFPNAPVAVGRLEAFNKITSDPTNQEAMVRALFDWRRSTSNLMNTMADKTERTAMKEMLAQFDTSMRETVRNALINGDETAVKLWQRAIQLRRGYGRLYEGNDIIGDILETTVRNGRQTTALSPEEVSNALFVGSRTGFINRPDLVRELRRVQSVLGKDSPEWNAIREEMFLRIAREGEGAFEGATRAFSGVKFKKAWADFQMRNPQLAKTMFSDEERKLIAQFGDVAAKVTGKVAGGDNTSNTAFTAMNMMNRMFKSFGGEKTARFLSGIPGINTFVEQAVNPMRAGAMFSGKALPPRIPVPGGVAVPAAGAAASQWDR